MILLIDNYDSFSYNLYQLIGEIEPNIRVIRNDEMTVEEIRALKPDRAGFRNFAADKGKGCRTDRLHPPGGLCFGNYGFGRHDLYA